MLLLQELINLFGNYNVVVRNVATADTAVSGGQVSKTLAEILLILI